MFLFAIWNWSINLPVPVALAVVALLGYLVGRRNSGPSEPPALQNRRELKRARHVARELEKIAESVRQHLAKHHASIVQFKDKVYALGADKNEASWRELCVEAENIIHPTLQLATQLASAYDEIRRQTGNLMSFTGGRTDPLTGVSNRRALDEHLESLLTLMRRYETPFSVVIFDIDNFSQINGQQGRLYGDSVLASVAKLIADGVRDNDMVTRYGGEEFVIVMPQATAEEACGLANRLRECTEKRLPLTVSGGVASVADGDTARDLLARANAALYGAKAAGRNCVFFHDGSDIQPSCRGTNGTLVSLPARQLGAKSRLAVVGLTDA